MASRSRDVQRDTWDVEAFERRAKERERAEKEAEQEKMRSRKAARMADHQEGDPLAPTRAWLQKRDHMIEFESKVGTTEIVSSAQAGGFHCKVCDVTLKDSNRFLSHLNSRAHQKLLGMSMRVRRSTVDDIKAAFAEAVSRRNARKKLELDRKF